MFLNVHSHSLEEAKAKASHYMDRGYKVEGPENSMGVYVVTVHRNVVTAKGFKDLTRKTKTMRAEGWIPVGSYTIQAGRLTQIFTKE